MPQSLFYRPDIDGLRAIAVLSVVIYHFFPYALPGGFTGVDVFFVISGFLIARIIFTQLAENRFSFADFYARRIRRIFPALILVLIATFAFGKIIFFEHEFALLAKHVLAGAGFASNFLLWSEAGYFDTASEFKPLLHLWSLGIEEQFYMLFPFLIFSAFQRRFRIVPLLFVLAAFSFLLNIFSVQHLPDFSFYIPLARFWELLAGALLAAFPMIRGGGTSSFK